MKPLFAALLLVSVMFGQPKPTLQSKDFGPWETITNAPGSFELSPDGKWLTYQITHSSRDNELRFAPVAGGEPTTVPFARQAAFSADSKWLAYKIGMSGAQLEKLRKDKKPVRDKLGIVDLSSSAKTVVDNVESFAISPDGKYLALRRYGPEKPDAEAPVGASLVVRDLATGKDTAFGNVGEYVWQDMPKTGHLLALTISGEEKTGNGVQLYDPSVSSVRVLDSSASFYSGLAWRKKSNDLAVLRTVDNDKQDGPTHIALAWTGLGLSGEHAFIYNPTKDPKFAAGMRIVAYRKPSWSDDAAFVFLGTAKWNPKPPSKGKDDADEPPGVDVWHWKDAEVLPFQKTRAQAVAHRNMLAAWRLSSDTLTSLSSTLTEQVTPLKNHDFSYAEDWTKYAMERSIGRPEINLSFVDNTTGVRTPVGGPIRDDRYLSASAGGKYLLYLQNDHYWTIDTVTRQIIDITKSVPTSFVDRESDFTVKQKPPFGVAGWIAGDKGVILYDKYDMWLVAPDGSSAKRLTDGAASEVRHTYIPLDRESEFIDTTKPLYVRLFGVWSKKSGFAKIAISPDGACKEEHLVLLDKSLDRLSKAKDADVFAYLSQTFTESPNVFVSSSDFKSAKAVTNTNPDQSKYAWGHAELIDYKNSKGEHLQGSLLYPADYQSGKQYPMVVYLYEKLSDNLHHYSAPSERDYYNASALTQHGYFVLSPDIVFMAREPGLSVADCVGAAVKKVVSMGAVDPKRIGVMGHSWGGFDTTFLATHTSLFAAAVAGAPITDLVSNYGNHHWSSGIAETDHIETGQQRMEVPLFEDLQAYIRNSAVFNVQNMTTPLLIEVGDSDGTVFYHQGVELYNIARRAKKNVVLLVYAGEDHGLSKMADQIDYHRRLVAWFDHYLKGDAAPTWITEGESYQQHQQQLKITKAVANPAPSSAQ